MANKIDKDLLASPVTDLCGNPDTLKGGGTENGGVTFDEGPQHKETEGLFQTVTYCDEDYEGSKSMKITGPTKSID